MAGRTRVPLVGVFGMWIPTQLKMVIPKLGSGEVKPPQLNKGEACPLISSEALDCNRFGCQWVLASVGSLLLGCLSDVSVAAIMHSAVG